MGFCNTTPAPDRVIPVLVAQLISMALQMKIYDSAIS
jgi:hypothetical protein